MAGYKIKTNRAARKRYKVTAKGHVRAQKKNHRHGFSNKSRKQKRNSRGMRVLGPRDEAMAKTLIPYA